MEEIDLIDDANEPGTERYGSRRIHSLCIIRERPVVSRVHKQNRLFQLLCSGQSINSSVLRRTGDARDTRHGRGHHGGYDERGGTAHRRADEDDFRSAFTPQLSRRARDVCNEIGSKVERQHPQTLLPESFASGTHSQRSLMN